MATPVASEAARLAAVHALAWPEQDPDACLDDIVSLAAALFEAPMVIISLAGAEQQAAIATYGVARLTAPREGTLCRHVIDGDAIVVIEDAKQDSRALNNAFVHGAAGIRFYAGAPLRCEDGHVLGTLCVVDVKPRRFGSAQQVQLTRLANMAERRLRGRALQADISRSHEARAAAEARTQSALREAVGAFVACDRIALNLEGRVRASLMRIERALPSGAARASAEVAALRDLVEELSIAARHDRIGAKGQALFEPSALVRAIGGDLHDYAKQRGVRIELADSAAGAEMLGDSWRLEELLESMISDCVLLSEGLVRVQSGFEIMASGRACFALRLSAERGASWRFSPRNRELVDAMAGCWELSREDRRIAVLLPARLKTSTPPPAPVTWGGNVVPFDTSRKGCG